MRGTTTSTRSNTTCRTPDGAPPGETTSPATPPTPGTRAPPDPAALARAGQPPDAREPWGRQLESHEQCLVAAAAGPPGGALAVGYPPDVVPIDRGLPGVDG